MIDLEHHRLAELGHTPGAPVETGAEDHHLLAGIRDIVGGRSAAYEKELAKAREIATMEMTTQAGELGADAIIAVDIDYETVGAGMLMVTLSGTAVRL